MSLCASTASPAPHLEQRPCAPPVTGPCQNPSEGSQCMLAPQARGERSVDERVGRSGGFFSPVGEVWSRGGLVAQVHPRRLCSAPAPWHCEAQPPSTASAASPRCRGHRRPPSRAQRPLPHRAGGQQPRQPQEHRGEDQVPAGGRAARQRHRLPLRAGPHHAAEDGFLRPTVRQRGRDEEGRLSAGGRGVLACPRGGHSPGRSVGVTRQDIVLLAGTPT